MMTGTYTGTRAKSIANGQGAPTLGGSHEDERWFPLVGPVLAAIVAVLGWFVGYSLNARRDQKTKRQELRIQHLIATYRRLEPATKPGATETVSDLESALSDIRLFGSGRQIAAVDSRL